MTPTSGEPTPGPNLRQQAETVLRNVPPEPANLSDTELQHLVHELQVHQVELELQNTELCQSQEELQIARDNYAELYDFAPVGYLTLDAQGTIQEANLTAATMLGVARSTLPGTRLSRYICREDQDTFYRHRQEVVAKAATQACDLRMQRPDDTSFVAHLESCAVGEANESRPQCRTTLSDITARKRAEDVLQAAHDELEEQVQARTASLANAYEELKRFTYVVSHDLRDPLINLRGFAKELQTACDAVQATLLQVAPHLTDAQRANLNTAVDTDIPESLGFIHAAVTRMDALIESLLTLAQAGRRPLDIEPIDLDALVHQLLQTLNHQIRDRQVRVSVGALPEFRADSAAIHQIMGHLLSNALTYLEPGRPGELRITAETGPDVTTIQVQDNGRGIAPADTAKVFEVFRRIGTQEVGGEGMGLAYVQMLVRRHGGDIWCQSTPGIRTTFTLTIANTLPAGDLPVS